MSSTQKSNQLLNKSKFLIIEFILGIFSVGFTQPIKGNQVVYLARIKQSITGLPVSDWFINSKDSNSIFTLICKILIINNNYLLMNIFNLILIFVGFHFLNTSVTLIMSIKWGSLDHLLVVFLSTAGLTIFSPDFHNGVAGMGFFSTQFQPSSFDCLLMISFCVVLNKEIKQAHVAYLKFLVPITVAILIHPSITLSACVLSFSFIICRHNFSLKLLDTNYLNWNSFIFLTLVIIPILFKYFSIETWFYTQQQLDAFDYLARVRIPYHVMPGSFLNLEELVRLLIIILALFFILRKKNLELQKKTFLVSSAFLTFYLTAALYLLDKPVINLSVPWRIFGGLYPFYCLSLLFMILNLLCQLLQKKNYLQLVAVLAIISVLLLSTNMTKFLIIFLAVFFVKRVEMEPSPIFWPQVIRKSLIFSLMVSMSLISFQKQKQTINSWEVDAGAFPKSDLLISMQHQGTGVVPTNFDNFRVEFGLSIFVDEKAPPHDADSLVTWVHRLLLAQKIQVKPNLLCEVSELQEISWAIIPNYFQKPSCFDQSSFIKPNWLLISKRN